jgi:hypothetical protein
MEIFIISFLVIALILILKDVSITIKINEEIEKHALSLEQTQQIYDEEMQRRKLLLLDIENFLSKAIFLKPFAILGGDKIFEYILTETRLYEFEDFMSDKNQRIRLNEDFLCFKKCRYKRVNELEKLNKILREMQDSNLKGVRNIDYKLSV